MRKSIDNACGNRVTFSLSGETAEREARYNIGEKEVVETNRSMSMGPHDLRDGIGLQQQRKREPLFLPSDIANLKDLTAIVRLKNHDFVLSDWQYQAPCQVFPAFILREDLVLEHIVGSQKEGQELQSEGIRELDLNIEPVMN